MTAEINRLQSVMQQLSRAIHDAQAAVDAFTDLYARNERILIYLQIIDHFNYDPLDEKSNILVERMAAFAEENGFSFIELVNDDVFDEFFEYVGQALYESADKVMTRLEQLGYPTY